MKLSIIGLGHRSDLTFTAVMHTDTKASKDKENNLETQLRCENLYSWQMMKETPMFSSWTECIEISRGVFAAGWLRHMVYQL